MQITKKILSIFLALTMLLGSVAVAANAAGNVSIKWSFGVEVYNAADGALAEIADAALEDSYTTTSGISTTKQQADKTAYSGMELSAHSYQDPSELIYIQPGQIVWLTLHLKTTGGAYLAGFDNCVYYSTNLFRSTTCLINKMLLVNPDSTFVYGTEYYNEMDFSSSVFYARMKSTMRNSYTTNAGMSQDKYHCYHLSATTADIGEWEESIAEDIDEDIITFPIYVRDDVDLGTEGTILIGGNYGATATGYSSTYGDVFEEPDIYTGDALEYTTLNFKVGTKPAGVVYVDLDYIMGVYNEMSYTGMESLYTAASLAVAEAAYNEALTVKGSDNPTQETIDAAAKKLKEAIEALAPACPHTNAAAGEALAPTCGAAGHTAGIYCPDCETWVEAQEEIAATGLHTDANGDFYCDVCKYYDAAAALAAAKQSAINAINTFAGETVSDAVASIVAEAILSINLAEDASGFDAIIANAKTAITAQRLAETTFSAENNVLTATAFDGTEYTLTLADDGTISAAEKAAWQTAGLTLPEIIFNSAANTASITAGDATATVTLASGTLTAHSVKIICGADANGKSYIAEVMPGTAVTVKAGTYEGKAFDKWNTALSFDGSANETVTFNMPNEDVTLEAEFVDCYALSVFDGATLSGEPQKVNTTVTVTAPTAAENKRFDGWTAEGITLTDSTAANLEFVMPANAVMLTANYSDAHTVTVTGGTASGLNASGKAFAGDTITITADADTDDARFTEWTSESDITLANKTGKTTTFTMPDADVAVAAQTEQSYTVTVTSGTVTAGLNTSGKAFAGDTVTVTANTVSGHNFTGWTGEGITFADASKATATFTMPAGNAAVKANYEQIKVAAPTASAKTYTYNGYAQTYQFADDGDKSYYAVTGATQTNAGTYTVKASLTADGTAWTDGTTADKEYTFVIGRAAIEKPQAYNTRYYYNGQQQTFILCMEEDGAYYYYDRSVPAGSVTISGTTRTNAGTQTVTVTPTANSCWTDGTTAAVTFDFTINKYPLPVLFSDPRSFTYNGKAQTYIPFVMMDDGIYDLDGAFYNLANRTQTPAGDYTVTATLFDNFCWADGTTAPKNFDFKIQPKKLNAYIYYAKDLENDGEPVCIVDISHTESSRIPLIKEFADHPGFYEKMLNDRYTPGIKNVPDGASVTFYLKEDMVTPKTLSEAGKCMKWDEVKMSDLKPDTSYYIFAVVSCSGYDDIQITEITEDSMIHTSYLPYRVATAHNVTEDEVSGSLAREVLEASMDFDIRGIIGLFINKPKPKTVEVLVKVAYFSDVDEALREAINDVEDGLDRAIVTVSYKGTIKAINVNKSNADGYKKQLAQSTLVTSARRMLADPADSSALISAADVPGKPAEFTAALLNDMFTPEALAELNLLDKEEFRIPMDADLVLEEMENDNTAMLEKLDTAGLIQPDSELKYTVTIDGILYDPQTECVDGASYEYEITANGLLPENAAPEIVGYTLDGLYYKEVFSFEANPEDNGMILTQGLTKWDPEANEVIRDTELWAIYVKDGATEPVGYKAEAALFSTAGNETAIELPAILDGTTYGDITCDNTGVTVSEADDGKVTVTLSSDAEVNEPITVTVAVNKAGTDETLYNIIVTVNPVDETEYKEAAKAAIDELVGDSTNEDVLAAAEAAKAAIDSAASLDDVNTAKDAAAQEIEELTAKPDFKSILSWLISLIARIINMFKIAMSIFD